MHIESILFQTPLCGFRFKSGVTAKEPSFQVGRKSGKRGKREGIVPFKVAPF
jgi:hypothetical protein